ncbi:MAG: hypothetical protein LKI53_09275 [Bacteroidales bacterium]|jgi:hypothetical protein|nr:hypothetical protein [Bacteroidales bacterium]
MADAEKRVDAMYFFGVSDFSYKTADVTEAEKGSYTVKDLILTLNYGGREEFYEIYGGFNRMILKRDLTRFYAGQYPDAGITKVEEYRRLMYITN